MPIKRSAVLLILTALPLCWLFGFNTAFQADWVNHMWLIGYVGEYFRHHLSLPITLNTDQLVGDPVPIYYGFLFYPIAGMLSIAIGANLAVRVILFGVLYLQNYLVARMITRLTGQELWGYAMALLVSFETYSLSNLYNRGAITEYIAVSLVVSALSIWINRFWVEGPKSFAGALLPFLLYVLAAGTHPITALYGAMFLTVICGATLIGHRAESKLALGRISVGVLLVALVLSQWAYLLIRYPTLLQTGTQKGLMLTAIDTFEGRFFPLPHDGRTAKQPLAAISSPYLEAQWNFPLVVFLMGLGFLGFRTPEGSRTPPGRGLYYCMLLCFLMAILINLASVTPWIWPHVPPIFRSFQFAYRIVTYSDLLLLTGVICGLKYVAGIERLFRPVLRLSVACSLVAAVSLMVKLDHGAAVMHRDWVPGSGLFESRDRLKTLPGNFYGYLGYAIPQSCRGGVVDLRASKVYPVGFRVGTGESFGWPSEVHVSAQLPGHYLENVIPHPFNRLAWNGVLIPSEEMQTDGQSQMVTTVARAGSGSFEYRLIPDSSWLQLRIISWLTLLGWGGYTAWTFLSFSQALWKDRIRGTLSSIFAPAEGDLGPRKSPD